MNGCSNCHLFFTKNTQAIPCRNTHPVLLLFFFTLFICRLLEKLNDQTNCIETILNAFLCHLFYHLTAAKNHFQLKYWILNIPICSRGLKFNIFFFYLTSDGMPDCKCFSCNLYLTFWLEFLLFYKWIVDFISISFSFFSIFKIQNAFF